MAIGVLYYSVCGKVKQCLSKTTLNVTKGISKGMKLKRWDFFIDTILPCSIETNFVDSWHCKLLVTQRVRVVLGVTQSFVLMYVLPLLFQ